MAIPPLLWLVLSLLVADGLVALYLAELLGQVGAGVVALGVAASWVAGTRARPPVRPIFTGLVLPAGAAASALDVMVLAPSILDGFVRFLLFIVVFRLWTLRSVRETRAVSVMVFLMLTAASSSFFGVGFLFAFVVFVILATWLALLQQVLIDAEPGPGRIVVGAEEALGAGRALLGLAVAASLAILAISAVWFFVIPRVMLAALPFRTREGPMVTGFSDRVELGSYGEIESDSTVIMRVHIADWMPEPDRLPNLRWRGVVLDHFDGRVWTIRQPRRIWPRRAVDGDVPVAIPRGTGLILVQEFYLEPLGTDVIFVAPRPVRLRLRAEQINQDDMDSLMVPVATARLNYVVASELEGPTGRPWVRPAPPLDEAAMARFLQLPPIAPRVEALARHVTLGSQDPQEAAQRLATFLSREYRYTLALERRTTLDPVEEFLFVRRSGNCEYFAAALAVMLRSLGIPARVVNGFQRGEWNPYGRYFMVRLADAHSWVEAHVGRAGWITLDPSPRIPAGARSGLDTVVLHLDALRVRWHRYVINWSLRDQFEAAMALRQQARSAWGRGGPWLASLRDVRPGPVAPAVAALGLLLGGLVVWRWRRAAASCWSPAGKPLPRFYARALRSLARSGLAPAPGETAREFCARVAGRAPGCAGPLGTLTTAYERGRFGARPLEPGDLPELKACLSALDRARPRHSRD
jgi:transglutaminase-like putative cysteine protease